MSGFSIGDEVRVRCKGNTNSSWPISRIGHIVGIDGGYIDVQPDGTWWLAEFYENELELISSCSLNKRQLAKWQKMVKAHYKERMKRTSP